jgi:hypothetical protein
MFDNFKAAFPPDGDAYETKAIPSSAIFVDAQLRELLGSHGGKSFSHGLYRIISFENVVCWNEVVLSAFPSFSGRITCFAMDWLGRVFALDSARLEETRPGVVLFEPGTGEALEIPCNLERFHESEIIEYRDEALAENFYHQWIEHGGVAPEVSQCIGYKKPLFLGGSDTVNNLEVSDLDVYWTISAQLIEKTRGLHPGSSIGKVTFG